MSRGNLAIIEAFTKGYRVTKDGEIYSHKGNRRKLRKNSNGYLGFNYRLSGNSQLWFLMVHRLQAYQKYGNRLFEADCVRHLDGNKLNNSYSNIAIGSIMDNWMDIKEEDRVRICATANVKYPISVAVEIREKYRRGYKMPQLMKEYGITSKGTFSHLLNKRIVEI